jgi:hypothetical protein
MSDPKRTSTPSRKIVLATSALCHRLSSRLAMLSLLDISELGRQARRR